jgi:hypothetical protein
VTLAPLFWARINPVAIYNGALFAALALSGFTMFLLASRLTGDITAGIMAGVVYAFAPYRFSHYMHLELQLVFWLPLGLLLIHRIVTDGRIRDGVWLGAVVTAQALSSVYAAMFFDLPCCTAAGCRTRRRDTAHHAGARGRGPDARGRQSARTCMRERREWWALFG